MADPGHGHVFPREDRARAKCGGPHGPCQPCRDDYHTKVRAEGIAYGAGVDPNLMATAAIIHARDCDCGTRILVRCRHGAAAIVAAAEPGNDIALHEWLTHQLLNDDGATDYVTPLHQIVQLAHATTLNGSVPEARLADQILRTIASTFTTRPGYRQEWS